MSLLQTADVERILAELSGERPVFHSEADFQFALALKMQQLYPQIAIRLERTEIVDNKRLRIDVLAHQDGQTTLIELKYFTRRLRVQVNLAKDEYETYNILDQAAHDLCRYDSLKDIQRLELLVERRTLKGHSAVGYAILLTNDSLFWEKPARDGVIDYAFRLHEGRTIAGGEALQWDERAGDGTKKGREEPITLRGDYTFRWRRYSNCLTHPRVKPFEDELTRYAEFRYLLVRVPPSG
jgi:hypothetical protein